MTPTIEETVAAILASPVVRGEHGYPELSKEAYEIFRDTLPHTFRAGAEIVTLLETREAAASHRDAAQALLRLVNTTGITAPCDLWVLRHVLAALKEIDPQETLVAEKVLPDARFLYSRGLIGQLTADARWPSALELAERLPPLEKGSARNAWRKVFLGSTLSESEQRLVAAEPPSNPSVEKRVTWFPSIDEIVIGSALLPLVLALSDAAWIQPWLSGKQVVATPNPNVARALQWLFVGGIVDAPTERGRLTSLGRRVLSKGPGVFGIIETYLPYLGNLPTIWRGETLPPSVWVDRTGNVAASQDANRLTFERMNGLLDQYCADTGFQYSVFIEHALGRGEATRQRWKASKSPITFVGADLEAASIEAAKQEQALGRLPRDMRFLSGADIGKPEILLETLHQWGISPKGAVMVVGNGFHEIRNQSTEQIVDVFRKYREAGIVLIFAEESLVSDEDLRETAWNTFNASFSYVHRRSGQGLRAGSNLSVPPGSAWATWEECGTKAGYRRIREYCYRGRGVYPYPRTPNPSIQSIQFFAPT